MADTNELKQEPRSGLSDLTVKLGAWISVKESLPDSPTQKVIVYVTRFNYAPWYMDIAQYRDGKWTEHESGNSAITHWMLLPEAPNV